MRVMFGWLLVWVSPIVFAQQQQTCSITQPSVIASRGMAFVGHVIHKH